MPRIYVRQALLVSLLVTTACTQPQAHVELKGQNVYGKNGAQENQSRSYASNSNSSGYKPSAPVYRSSTSNYANQAVATGPTEKSAAVQSIGVSDLAPPSQSAPAPAVKQAAKPQSVNQWTGKPRENEKTVAELDTVISKSDTKEAVKAKPVRLISDSKDSEYIWPVNSKKVTSSFGPKGSGKSNDGINIASAEGEPVWAAADGEVIGVKEEFSGYGNMVIIKHAGDKSTTYAHLSQATVDKYDRVKQGDIIGYVGTSGNVKKPQLYFAVHDGKAAIDPKKVVSSSLAGL
ncbi:MAG: murein hydrolase activator EnvC family protein [Alphaproteobacteria bacterium]